MKGVTPHSNDRERFIIPSISVKNETLLRVPIWYE